MPKKTVQEHYEQIIKTTDEDKNLWIIVKALEEPEFEDEKKHIKNFLKDYLQHYETKSFKSTVVVDNFWHQYDQKYKDRNESNGYSFFFAVAHVYCKKYYHMRKEETSTIPTDQKK